MGDGERAAPARIAMGRPEGLRAGPGLEGRARGPEAVGGVEGVVVLCGTLEKMERDEAWHLAKIAVAVEPARLEGCLLALAHLEAIHRDVHVARLLSACGGRDA